MDTLAKVKEALGITGNDRDSYILGLINAAMIDLGIAGVDGTDAEISNDMVLLAVEIFCNLHGSFGMNPADADKLKRSYDELKAQMSMATGYTLWER